MLWLSPVLNVDGQAELSQDALLTEIQLISIDAYHRYHENNLTDKQYDENNASGAA